MVLDLILFVVGFYILVKGSNLLIDGASAVARFFRVPGILIGLLIAGIGTSIPEFAVAITSHLKGTGEIGLGTIAGSNTFNILFILGITAAFFTLPFKKEWGKDLIWNIFAIVAVSIFIFGFTNGAITAIEGLILLALFILWLFVVTIDNLKTPEDEEDLGRNVTLPIASGLIIAGILGVFFGGEWVVSGATIIAEYLGASKSLIGLTIVGIGTSLPELTVTFIAAYRGKIGLAVGNIIGSNIFDFLMILGVAAIVKPIVINENFRLDMAVTLIAAILLYSAMFIKPKDILKRWQGVLFVAIYLAYLIYIIFRG